MRPILVITSSDERFREIEAATAALGAARARASSPNDLASLLDSLTRKPALALLDLDASNGRAFDLLKHLRDHARTRDVPVTVFSERNDLELKVAAFSLGADEYLTFPIHPIELEARIAARLRKADAGEGWMSVIQSGPVTLNIPLLKATVAERGERGGTARREVDLTAKEFRLLSFLIQRSGESCGRSEIVKAVWGSAVHVLDRTVDSHVCSLRRKLGPHGACVKSVPGLGYRYVTGREEEADASPAVTRSTPDISC